MERTLRCCGCTLGAVAVLFVMPAPAAATPAEVQASVIEAGLRGGRTIVRSHVVVSGELDLRADVVHGAFKCRGCTFKGPLAASDAIFERTVDLTGSTFESNVNLSGATFRGPALFRASSDADLVFERRTDFSLAVFENIASFGTATFSGGADFQDARFAEVTFASATFEALAAFDRAAFQSTASFSAALFEGPAVFADTDFRDRADFGVAEFDLGATFSLARFGRDASFLAADFYAPNRRPGEDEQEAAAFDGVISSGNLDFTFAEFKFESAPRPRPRKASRTAATPRLVAIFDDTVCGRALIFRKTEFQDEDEERFAARLKMTRIQAADLVLNVDEAHRIANVDDRQDVLSDIEESAKARGELSVANSAHFKRLTLQSRDYSFVPRVLDFVFYRNVAGYFVRPFRPLLILVVLATFFGVLRYFRQPSGEGQPAERAAPSGRIRSAQQHAASFLTCILDTFALVLPRSSSRTSLTLGERFQVIAYRLLLVCALIGLANSNPTLRNMVDTLL
jgi:uncharacterized protein YjbI with pentapeptide repeats